MKLSFQYQDEAIQFDVTYSRRKTISIVVEAPGKVSVKAPEGIPDKELVSRVESKAKWIIKKLHEMNDIQNLNTKKSFANGELFMYLGEEYSLEVIMETAVKKPVVELFQSKLIVTTPTEDKELIKRAIELWYRRKAREHIQERIEYYQPRVGVKPNRITVKEQKRRWGSCSSKGNLNFNWRAVMAPLPVLDYLIVHELCHLIHHNHSRDYWKLVASILPDYKPRREWLKKNGIKLSM